MTVEESALPRARETQFEVRRGVGQISVEHGFAQIHVSEIASEIQAEERLRVFQRVAEKFVSLRFPKFTPSGLSFLVDEAESKRAEEALRSTGDRFSIRGSRSVVTLHAPSIREEEGLIGKLVAALMESGTPIDHIADAHDRLMAVVRTEDVRALVNHLSSLVESSPRAIGAISRRGRHRIKILKFGGTSVATAEARAFAAQKVAAAVQEGYRPVVVVSAIGRDGLPYATDTLIGQAQEACPGRPPDPRDLDLMLSCGEILSAVIFAQTLNAAGLPAQAFRGDQAGILTDEAFGKARIVGVRPARLEVSLRNGFVPVVCGFQGCVGPDEGISSGEVTTLGRGGSDTTAAALGAALGANAVEIYTDVDGVMTADPRVVAWARTLWTASYDEVASLAHLGAKVVHPRAVEIAMAFNTPLWVKNTFSDERGTEIAADERCRGPRRTGVTHFGDLIYFRFDLRQSIPDDRTVAELMIFRHLAEAGVNVLMVDLSPTSAGLAIPKASYACVERILDELDLPTSIVQPCSMVSIVGRDYIRTPGTLRDCLAKLASAGVRTIQTNAIDPSLSFLVPEEDTKTTIKTLFEYHESMSDDD